MTKEEQMYREERQLKTIVKCNLMTTDCVTTGTVARRLKMKACELYRKLKERKILYHSDGMWMLMPEYMGLGLLRYRYTLYYTLLGEKRGIFNEHESHEGLARRPKGKSITRIKCFLGFSFRKFDVLKDMVCYRQKMV